MAGKPLPARRRHVDWRGHAPQKVSPSLQRLRCQVNEETGRQHGTLAVVKSKTEGSNTTLVISSGSASHGAQCDTPNGSWAWSRLSSHRRTVRRAHSRGRRVGVTALFARMSPPVRGGLGAVEPPELPTLNQFRHYRGEFIEAPRLEVLFQPLAPRLVEAHPCGIPSQLGNEQFIT